MKKWEREKKTCDQDEKKIIRHKKNDKWEIEKKIKETHREHQRNRKRNKQRERTKMATK